MKTRTFCKTDVCRKYANLNPEGYCPTCRPVESQEIQDEQTASICGNCSKDIDDNYEHNRAIGCDICSTWFHSKCAGPSELLKLLDCISNNIGETKENNILGMLLWICPKCSNGADKCFKLSNTSSEIVPASHIPVINATTHQQQLICKLYKAGKCPPGISGKKKVNDKVCEHHHPKRCNRFCKFGPYSRFGCNKRKDCKFFSSCVV